MEIGIDSFAAANSKHDYGSQVENAKTLEELLERITYADEVGLDTFGIGEHYRKEFLDSAPALILAAAAAKTKKIRLSSAVTVLSAADPVRVFQSFSTLDLISKGRAENINLPSCNAKQPFSPCREMPNSARAASCVWM